MAADLTIDIADESGQNAEDQHVVRQLEAGKRVLTEVRRLGTKRRSGPACRLREGE